MSESETFIGDPSDTIPKPLDRERHSDMRRCQNQPAKLLCAESERGWGALFLGQAEKSRGTLPLVSTTFETLFESRYEDASIRATSALSVARSVTTLAEARFFAKAAKPGLVPGSSRLFVRTPSLPILGY